MSEQAYVHQRVIDLEQQYRHYTWPDLMTVLIRMIAALEYKVHQLELKNVLKEKGNE